MYKKIRKECVWHKIKKEQNIFFWRRFRVVNPQKIDALEMSETSEATIGMSGCHFTVFAVTLYQITYMTIRHFNFSIQYQRCMHLNTHAYKCTFPKQGMISEVKFSKLNNNLSKEGGVTNVPNRLDRPNFDMYVSAT